MSGQTVRVLMVEDNPADARLLELGLGHAGEDRFQLVSATRLSDAMRLIGEASFDAVLLDLSLPDCTGLQTIERMGGAAAGIPIIVLTGWDDETTAIESLSRGAQDYLIKGQADGRAVARALRYAIHRKRAETPLRENEARLRLALQAGRIGTWEVDGSTWEVRCSEYCDQLFDLVPEPGPRRIEAYLERVHPEDQARLREIISGLLEAGGEYYLEFRIALPDGQTRWVAARGEVIEATASSAVRLTGSLMDVAPRKLAEEQMYADAGEEQERQGLVQVLHDHLQQLLIEARLKLRLVREIIGQGDLRPRLQHIDELLRESIKVSRSAGLAADAAAMSDTSTETPSEPERKP